MVRAAQKSPARPSRMMLVHPRRALVGRDPPDSTIDPMNIASGGSPGGPGRASGSQSVMTAARATTVDVVQAGGPEEPAQAAADGVLGATVLEVVEDLAGDGRFGVVDGERAPVGVDDDHRPAGTGHPHHLGQGRLGLGEPLEGPLRPGGVEGVVGEGQGHGVAHLELGRDPRRRGPPAGLGEHGGADVDADGPPAGPDGPGQGDDHVARAAADVEEAAARTDPEPVGGVGPQLPDRLPIGRLVHGPDQQRRVGHPVDAGETLGKLDLGHRPILWSGRAGGGARRTRSARRRPPAPRPATRSPAGRRRRPAPPRCSTRPSSRRRRPSPAAPTGGRWRSRCRPRPVPAPSRP